MTSTQSVSDSTLSSMASAPSTSVTQPSSDPPSSSTPASTLSPSTPTLSPTSSPNTSASISSAPPSLSVSSSTLTQSTRTTSTSPSAPPSASTPTPTSTTPPSTPSPTPASTSAPTPTPTPTSTSPSTSTSTSISTSISTPISPSTPNSTPSPSFSQQTDTTSANTPSSTSIIPPDHQSSSTNPISVVITSISISTANNGQLTTVTDIHTIPNPTLSTNNNATQGDSTFFRNTGAVAGVFILVGLAVASIILWIFLAIRSRRRTQRLEHDTAVAATLAAAGFNRAPLDDDDDPAQGSAHSRYGSTDPFLRQRRSSSGLAMSSLPSRTSAAFPDENDPHVFHPYSDYIPPPTVSSPPFITRPYRTRSSSNTMGENVNGHTPQHSGSHEPLLASYNRTSPPPSPTRDNLPPQRSLDAVKSPPSLSEKPQQQSNAALEASPAGDQRLDPNLSQRFQNDADSFRDLRDEEDYSRPVLGVRNMPDTPSQASIL